MIKLDEDALICDLAETYQIYDYKQLPPIRVAVFSYGLPDHSRIKMKLSGQTVTQETLLLAGILDRLSTLVWFQTEDGQKGKNRPKRIIDLFLNTNNRSDKDVVVYHSGKEFDKARKKLLGGE